MFQRRFTGVVCVCAVFVLIGITPGAALARGNSGPSVVARDAIVIDAASGDILYAKKSDEQVAPASLTKLFTAAYAVEMVPRDTVMTAEPSDLIGEANIGLRAGESLGLETLLHGMLMASGNDAAMVVARSAAALSGDEQWQATQRFLDYANARNAALGLTETHLANPHGLDEAGHFSSAHDIAAITLFIARNDPDLLAIAGSTNWSGDGHVFANTNQLLGRYQGLIAGKTGFTANAGYCLVEVAQRNGRAVIAVLLGSTEDAWYDDATALLDYGFTATIAPGSHPLGQVELSAAGSPVNASPAQAAVADVTRLSDDASVVHALNPVSAGIVDWRLAVVVVFSLGLISLAIAAWPRDRRRARGPRPVVAPLATPRWDTGPIHLTNINAHEPFAGFGGRFLLEETDALPVLNERPDDLQSRRTNPRRVGAIRPPERRAAGDHTSRWPSYRLGNAD